MYRSYGKGATTKGLRYRLVRTAYFGAEAERSYFILFFWQFDPEEVLKMFLRRVSS